MGQGDFMPTGGGHQHKADPKRAKKIKEGGKRADVIRQKANEHHEAKEIPYAENQLMKDLEKIA